MIKRIASGLTSAVVVGIIDVVVLVVAIACATRVGYVAQIFGGAIGVISVVTFVGFFKEFATQSDGQMRAAITASFLLVYLFVFGLVAFSPQLQGLVRGVSYGEAEPEVSGPGRISPDGELPATEKTVAQDLFDSLSGVVTAIIGFYFAGAAVEGAATKLGARGTPPDTTGSAGLQTSLP